MISTPRTSSHFTATRRGITLIELVVTVLLMSVLGSVAVPRYLEGVDGYRAESTAQRIVADLERARRNAKFTGVTRRVIFKVANNRCDLIGLSDPDDPTASLYRTEFAETPYPATLVSAVFTHASGSDDELKFDMYCNPLVGSVPMTSGTIVVQSGSQQRTVVVNAITGEASVQ